MKHQPNPTRSQEHGNNCTTETEEIEGKNHHEETNGTYAGKGQDDFVAVFMDGKGFAEYGIVLVMGITLEGKKRVLGFVRAAALLDLEPRPPERSHVDQIFTRTPVGNSTPTWGPEAGENHSLKLKSFFQSQLKKRLTQIAATSCGIRDREKF